MATLAELQEKRGGEITRRRILEAARARFSTASYEDVKLRDIAAEVGVDVALVHRAFGSKEQLFSAVLSTSKEAESQSSLDARRLSADFADGFFGAGQNETLQIVVRSLTNPQAREVLRARSLTEFIGPVAAALEGPSTLERATLFNACLVGMAIFREVLGAQALQDANSAKTRPLIERILAACLAEDGAAEPKEDGPTKASRRTRGRKRSRRRRSRPSDARRRKRAKPDVSQGPKRICAARRSCGVSTLHSGEPAAPPNKKYCVSCLVVIREGGAPSPKSEGGEASHHSKRSVPVAGGEGRRGKRRQRRVVVIEEIVDARIVARIGDVAQIDLRSHLVALIEGRIAREAVEPRPAGNDESVLNIAPGVRRGGDAAADAPAETMLAEIIGEEDFSGVARRIVEMVLIDAARVEEAEWIERILVASEMFATRFDVQDNALDIAISRLRRRLDALGAGVSVHTLRGVGYMLTEHVG